MNYKEIIKNNYQNVCNKVRDAALKVNRNPNDIKILAVSKTHDHSVLTDAINAGIPIFAESYAQEFRDKYKELSLDTDLISKCEFHFIGHLQTNKVKYIVPNVTTIHTVDTINLANEINKQAEKINKTINILIQINTSGEVSKSGISPDKCVAFTKELLALNNTKIIGLMTIGTFSEDEKIIKSEFSTLRNCLLETNKINGINLKELSMGMSHDFEIAIQHQATMIRIGTAIFGERNYL
jgi:pyridoxal phosphate enzyme (YggS family)